jgi:hypothetical protein
VDVKTVKTGKSAWACDGPLAVRLFETDHKQTPTRFVGLVVAVVATLSLSGVTSGEINGVVIEAYGVGCVRQESIGDIRGTTAKIFVTAEVLATNHYPIKSLKY